MNENTKLILQISGSAFLVAYLTNSQTFKSKETEKIEEEEDVELIETEKIKQIESNGKKKKKENRK